MKSINLYGYLIATFFSILSICGSAQSLLTLDQAISIALEQNYGIQISMMERQADEMQVYKSNAGYGPTVDWNVNYSMTGNNVNQRFIDERSVSRFGRSFSPNTSVSLGLTLYDGGRMEATYIRLGLLSQHSVLQGKIIIQNTILDVMATYYDIVRQKETLAFYETVITNYEERLKITEERWNVGKGSKLDFLQSKTDLNAQLAERARVKNNLKNGKVSLNGLLNRDPNLDFDVENIETSQQTYQLEKLNDQALLHNRDLLLLQKSMEISSAQEAAVAAARAPQVSLNGSVGYSYFNTNAGFLVSNRSVAATVGVSARYNLFDGSHRKNQIAISKIHTSIIEKQHESLEAQIINDITFAYNQYESDRELLEFENQNRIIAEENLSISLDKFRLGGSSILELNEAQRAYDTALNRLVNAQYNIKISSLELLRLSGGLVE